MTAEVADCSRVPEHLQQLAGIFSVFGLMLLPKPQAALANWVDALAPGVRRTMDLHLFADAELGGRNAGYAEKFAE